MDKQEQVLEKTDISNKSLTVDIDIKPIIEVVHKGDEQLNKRDLDRGDMHNLVDISSTLENQELLVQQYSSH